MSLKHFYSIFALLLFALCAGANAQTKPPEYQIGAGDTLRILVYQNPDLTLETRVTETGTITFPLIGVARIGGMTISSAEAAIANALKTGGFIKQPQVTIVPTVIRSNQVSVLGQVARPGRFPLETFNTRLSEVIAMAGGITATGADTVILTGTRDGQAMRKEVDVSGMFLDSKLQEDVPVTGGDVIYVHRMPVFYIYGEVQKPGSYRLERGMTVRQALAQGGGPTVRGTERRLNLFRKNGAATSESSPNLNNVVKPDDILFVGESLF